MRRRIPGWLLIAFLLALAVASSVSLAIIGFSRGDAWAVFVNAIIALAAGLIGVGLYFSDRALASVRALHLEIEANLALIAAARRRVVMPELDMGADGRVRSISFPPVSIPKGETVSWAIPRIRGWPPMEMLVRREGMEEGTRVRVNWEEGTVDIFDGGGLHDFTIEVERDEP